MANVRWQEHHLHDLGDNDAFICKPDRQRNGDNSDDIGSWNIHSPYPRGLLQKETQSMEYRLFQHFFGMDSHRLGRNDRGVLQE